LAGLLILKQLYGLSDEGVIEVWRMNPFYQIFTGSTSFTEATPCDPTTLVKFRQRIGPDGVKVIFDLSVKMHLQSNEKLQKPEFIVADTTVQPKYTAFPTDHKLIFDALVIIEKIGKASFIHGLDNVTGQAKSLLKDITFKKGKCSHEEKEQLVGKLRGFANKIYRKVFNGISKEAKNAFADTLDNCKKAINQKKNDKNKIYSLFEPDVKCIAKGKPHKPYEFGSKVSIAIDLNSGVIVAAQNHPDNPYDGNTLEQTVAQTRENMPDADLKYVSCDLGYRGQTETGGLKVITPDILKYHNCSNELRELYEMLVKKRSSVEPPFSHMKSCYGLGRNFLHGIDGDAINLYLSAAAYNIKKFIQHVLGCDRQQFCLRKMRKEVKIKQTKRRPKYSLPVSKPTGPRPVGLL
jgi:IS5 family transposase